MLRSPESEMTHFNWSPGIGDPTLTVILYLVTSMLLDLGAQAWSRWDRASCMVRVIRPTG
jgi:hypothetical protein